ncbi:MAG: hypothetical protein CME71_03340 [Halobacteriovorax sp.]|nr:hypothetical protein [Halobacteriovorax sp.]
MKIESIVNKVKGNIKNIGKDLVRQVLLLFYAYPKSPKKVKAVIASSIAYFILPLDAVPDPIPFLGFLDDATVLAAALGIVRFYVDDEVKEKANKMLDKLFNSDSDATK